MKLLFPVEPTDRDQLGAMLVELGFEVVADEPATHGTRWTTWRREEDAVAFGSRGRAGTSAIKIVGPAEERLAVELAGRVPSRSPADLLAAPGSDTVARLRSAFLLGTLVYVEGEHAEDAKRLLREMLLDEEDLVRWAAVESLPIDVDSVAALAASAARYPEMRGVHARMDAARIAREEGTLHDTETDDRWELLSRAREGVRDGKWRRVAKAMDVLLAESPWDDEGLFLRGLAHEGEGEVLEALFLLGAAESALAGSEQVRRSVDEEKDDDAPDDDDAFDDDDSVTNEDLVVVRAKLPSLRERALAATPEEQARAGGFVVRWLKEWQKGMNVGQVNGGAKALAGRLPELQGLLLYLVGNYDGNEAILSEALAILPDAPSIELALAHAVMKRDEAEGERRLWALLERLREAPQRSPAAALVEEVVAAAGERRAATEAGVLEILAKRAYDAKDYENAAELGDRLVALDPDTGLGWQLRANARIFALRHEEAVVACTEAIANLDRIYARGDEEGSIFFGEDPRAGMYFNRACVEAKVGRHDEAIESLRIAVRKNAKYADEAVADDYLESLFENAEFIAITKQDPRALRTPEERDPAWVKGLVARARDEQQGGDVRSALTTAERAAELAEHLGDPAVRVEAHAVLGRMRAFTGDLDGGLDAADRAVGLASHPGVGPEVRALAHAQRGICLQAAMRLDEAEAEYERALEERRAAFGEAHPSLVKSIVSIVGVALMRERPAAEVEALIARGVDIAQAFFSSAAQQDHVWAEAIDDLVSLLVRRSLLRRSNGETAEAVQPLALALERLEEQRAVGYVPMAAVVDQIRTFADEIAKAAPTPAVASAATEVRRRAEAILIPGPPEERRARLVFRRVRGFLDELRAGGVDDQRIAGLLSDIVRGGEGVPEELRHVEALADLRAVLAAAAAREPTVLVTSAMSLSIAAMPGELDRALKDLEDLVAPVVADEPS